MKRMLGLVLLSSVFAVVGCASSGGGQASVEPPINILDVDPLDKAAVSAACEATETTCGMLAGTSAYCGGCSGSSDVCWSGQCVGSDVCAHESLSPLAPPANFYPMAEAAFTRLTGGKFKLFYVATQGGAEPPFTKITVEIDHNAVANRGVGTYDLTSADGDLGCSLCVRGHSYCNSDGCAQAYLPESGQLEITSAGEAGTLLKASLKNVVFKQYKIEGGKYVSYAKGYQWCLGDYNIELEVPALSEAEDYCLTDGTGKGLGDNIADYSLTNCLGEEVPLHTRCGLTDAVWMVASAGWCGACDVFVPKVGEYYTTAVNEGRSLDIMILYAETASGVKPTLDDCLAYADSKGIDPAQTFIDKDGDRSWGNTFDHIENYSGGSLGIPWSVILDGKSMEYLWSTTVGTGSVYHAVEELIGHPGS